MCGGGHSRWGKPRNGHEDKTERRSHADADPVPEYLLPQLAGSYFDRVNARRVEPRVGLLPDTSAKLPSPAQPQLTRVDNLPLYRGYNDPNAEATAAFKAAGKPVQHYANGAEVPTEPAGDLLGRDSRLREDDQLPRV